MPGHALKVIRNMLRARLALLDYMCACLRAGRAPACATLAHLGAQHLRTYLRNTCAPTCATLARLGAQHLRACLRRTHYCLCTRLSLVLLEVLGDFGAWFCRKAVFGPDGGVAGDLP